ncbi:hypothetical protein E2C01_012728 [Portunus trituberculatus]|uniref:Uncharacterized protein n=1 Tax=Portunus trituberculatus TaxID=210409 RepID=A0A5B7DF70_PORTR|nr:hypothetical protein [Portunus trituberculatus]
MASVSPLNAQQQQQRQRQRQQQIAACKSNTILTSLESMTVPTPTVRACLGTLDMSLSKKRALAVMVSWFKVLTRVRDTKLEPEFNATCFLNLLFILLTLYLKVWRITIKDVSIGWVDINVFEEVLPHEAVITLVMIPGNA